MTMPIAFLTLFFGLISGPYPVELTVEGPAAAVEIQVDGRPAARIEAPPWRGVIDFGAPLLPHQVVARALDAQGHELGRTEEWANLPHPLTKVDIVLERQGERPPTAAEVRWKNLAGEKLRSISLAFDGLPVRLDAGGRGVLPKHDLATLHLLSAEVEFASHQAVRRELAYGGEYGSEVSTELTGVPVHTLGGRLPPAAGLGGWFAADGKPLTVNAVEEGPAQLFVVSSVLPDVLANAGHRLRNLTGSLLGSGDQILLVSPAAQRIVSAAGVSDLFQITAPFPYGSSGDLFAKIRRTGFPAAAGRPVRLGDAVAAAGLAAMKENRRRAVLLVLGGGEEDASLYDAATIRRFLAALRVPLFVWSLTGAKPASAAEEWGAEEISQTWHVAGAAVRIRAELDAQRIVMVDGRHLPQSITLTPAAKGIELAGGPMTGPMKEAVR
jgi:hypothetical protein